MNSNCVAFFPLFYSRRAKQLRSTGEAVLELRHAVKSEVRTHEYSQSSVEMYEDDLPGLVQFHTGCVLPPHLLCTRAVLLLAICF